MTGPSLKTDAIILAIMNLCSRFCCGRYSVKVRGVESVGDYYDGHVVKANAVSFAQVKFGCLAIRAPASDLVYRSACLPQRSLRRGISKYQEYITR